MKTKLRYSYTQPQLIERNLFVEINGVELQRLTDQQRAGEFEPNVAAYELISYMSRQGEFATFVDVAGTHKEIERLLRAIAYAAHMGGDYNEIVESEIVIEGDEENFTLRDATVAAG